MRLLIRRGHSLINDLRFTEGPIYVGRQPRSQVFLPDRSVSRQHAVIFSANDGSWMVQDLDSANQTLVNSRPISRMPLHEGDVIGVSDFTLEVHFDPERVARTEDKPLDLGDTIVGVESTVPAIFRREVGRQSEQGLHLKARRIQDLYELTVTLCQKTDQESLLTDLTRILLEQFDAYHVWAGLRETTSGPLTCHGGCSRGGNIVSMEQLAGKPLIKQSLKDESYILLPSVADLGNPTDSTRAGLENLRSAMAAPIVAPAGVYGIIYVDNGIDQGAYTPHNLDYLVMVSTQVAAFIEHIG